MASKQQKYIHTRNLYKLFKDYKNNFFVFVHLNNLNIIENTNIQNLCVKYNVSRVKIKLTLMDKITKNVYLKNLLSGPTELLIFSDFEECLSFFEQIFIQKKYIPLAVYWNNQFYSYNFFITFFKSYRNNFKSFKYLLYNAQSVTILNLKNYYIRCLNLLNIKVLLFILFNHKNNLIKK